jgi:outer membrane protein assembly factor BamB
MKRLFRFAACAVLGAIVLGCAQNSHYSALPLASGADLTGPAAAAKGDDWATFAHDYLRTGDQLQTTRLSPKHVKLPLRWKRALGLRVYASPLAYAGNVVVVTTGNPGAMVYDLRASDGAVLWSRSVGQGSVRATPTIDPANGLLFVGTRYDKKKGGKYVLRADIYALDLTTGSVVWERTQPGWTHGGSVATGGTLYIGISGGDAPYCVNGGVLALDELTGKVRWNWRVDTAARGGGSVWGAIAYDGAHLIFGTGNTCHDIVPTANGAVALDTHGQVQWNFAAIQNSPYDDDTGSGVALTNGQAWFMNKNGTLYDVAQGSGQLQHAIPLGANAAGFGMFASPSTDGKRILIGSGLYPDKGAAGPAGAWCPLDPAAFKSAPNAVIKGYHSYLKALDAGGKVAWSHRMSNYLVGYVAINDGVAIVGLDDDLVALDVRNGKRLWHYAAPTTFDASAVIVPSGVYAADAFGNVYAFTIK